MKTSLSTFTLVVVLLTISAVAPLRAVDPAALAPVSSAPAGGTFLGLTQTNWPPMPIDPFPNLPLYTDGTNYYYDDSGADTAPARASNVRVAGAEEVTGPPNPGSGPFTGPGSTASAAQFYPPTNNMGPCETYLHFWLTISATSNVVHLTITNAMSGVAYTLLEKTNLSQPDWTPIGTLTNLSGSAVSTNVNVGTNLTAFFEARLTAYDTPPVITWTKALGGSFNSSPALGPDGTIYLVNEANQIFAFNPLNGNPKWTNTFATNLSDYPPNSSPTVAADGSVVYAGSQDDQLVAFDPANGATLWTNYLGGIDDVGAAITGTPALGADGEIYVGTFNSDRIGLFALNPATHAVDWAFTNLNPINGAGERNITGSVAIGPDCTSYFLSYNDELNALNRDGSLKWFFPIYEGVEPTSSPVVDSNGVVYAVSMDGYLYAISPLGTLLWLYDTGTQAPIESSPALGPDGTVYFGSLDGNVYAVANGKLVWRFSAPGGTEFESSPAIGADGTVYIGAGGYYGRGYYDGIYALTNGGVKWSFDTDGPVNSSPTLDACGTLYVATEDGKVYALAASPPADSSWPMFGQNARHANAAANTGCSEPDGPSFFLSNMGEKGDPTTFLVHGPIGTNCDIYVSTNLSSWNLLASDVQMQTSDGWADWTNFVDTSAGAGTGNRFYQARSGSFCSDILGYVTVSLAKGTNLVANQFYGINDFGPVLGIPESTLAGWSQFLTEFGSPLSSDLTVLKWDGTGFETNSYRTATGDWAPNGDTTLLPGESAFIVASNVTTTVFGGRIPRGTLVNPIDSRTNYLSSILPVAGYLTNLQFNASSGDTVRLYAPGSNNPTSYTYSGRSWSPSTPYLHVGQGFVLITTNVNNNWQTNFSVCAGE